MLWILLLAQAQTQADPKVESLASLIALMLQGGPTAMTLTGLYFMARHHRATLREHKKELAAKDDEVAELLQAHRAEITSCRAEIATCQSTIRDMEVNHAKEMQALHTAFREETKALLKDQLEHEAELLRQIKAELKGA